MAKRDVDELERRRGLWAALTPEDWEAKGAEAEKRIAAMGDDELIDELYWRSPKPNVDELVAAGVLIDEAIKRRLLVPLTLEIAEDWIAKWERDKIDNERVSTHH